MTNLEYQILHLEADIAENCEADQHSEADRLGVPLDRDIDIRDEYFNDDIDNY